MKGGTILGLVVIGGLVLFVGAGALRKKQNEQAHAQNLADSLKQNFLIDARRNIALQQAAQRMPMNVSLHRNTTQSMAGFMDKSPWDDTYHALQFPDREGLDHPIPPVDQVDSGPDFQGW